MTFSCCGILANDRVMTRVKAIYRSWAIPCTGNQVYAPRHRAEWLGKITEPGVRRREEFTTNNSRETLSVRVWRRRSSFDNPKNIEIPCEPARFQLQYSRNPRRCQAITVSGLTIIGADRQPLQSCESQTHRSRSVKLRRARRLQFLHATSSTTVFATPFHPSHFLGPRFDGSCSAAQLRRTSKTVSSHN
jgi:hypothetical protein